MTVVFDQAMEPTARRSDADLRPGRGQHVELDRRGVWSAGDTTYTATYSVADANVDLTDVTVDVTGAKDANGNAQLDYTPRAEFSIDTLNPTVASVTANDA